MRNNRLFNKEESINYFIENCKRCGAELEDACTREVIVEKRKSIPTRYFIPNNLISVAYALFSRDNVYVALTPSEYYFNKHGDFMGELAVFSMKGHRPSDIIQSVDDYLRKGAIIFIYNYCGIRNNIITDEGLISGYYWRMAVKKE
jgi:hypothetical protein